MIRDNRYLFIDKWDGCSCNMVLDDAWLHFTNLLSQTDTIFLNDATIHIKTIQSLLV